MNPPVRDDFNDKSSIREIWCGSEFTVACDEFGLLWACGWNEHGNLGDGTLSDSYEWKPVLISDHSMNNSIPDSPMVKQLRLSHVWEASVATGGGHCLCIA
jgi:alpha-tubulin suppressor-like RCC1 family protein